MFHRGAWDPSPRWRETRPSHQVDPDPRRASRSGRRLQGFGRGDLAEGGVAPRARVRVRHRQVRSVCADIRAVRLQSLCHG
jgi:hypothetical protein